MDFGQIKNKFLGVLGVTILKNQNIHNFLLRSPFFMSVTLPEQQNSQNLIAWFMSFIVFIVKEVLNTMLIKALITFDCCRIF